LTEKFSLISEELEMSALNEALQSSILRTIMNAESKSKWQNGIAKDLATKFGVAVDQLQDTDFQLIQPDQAFSAPYKGDENKLIFMLNDDKGIYDAWSDWKKKGNKFPFLLGIIRGGTNVWYGFNRAPSGFGSRKQSATEKYGILSDAYKTSDYYGYNSKVKPTQKAFKELSTVAYVLDLAAIQEKYSTKEKKAERAAAKKGATALLSNKEIKNANIERYKVLASEGVTPDKVYSQFKALWSKALNGVVDVFDSLNLSDLDTYEKSRSIEMKIGGSWSYNPARVLEQIYRTFENFISEYQRFAEYSREIENATQSLEDADSDKAVKLQGSIDYYTKRLDTIPRAMIEYKQQFAKYDKDLDAGLEKLNSQINKG
jgi:hypothetical protein